MKRVLKGILIMLFILMLCGCGAEALSDKYNKYELEKISKEIVTLINEKNYKAVYEKSSDFLKSNSNIEELEKGHNIIIGNFSKFESFIDINFQEKNGYAVIINKVKHEKGELRYVTTFGEELKLEEFRIM